MIQLKGKKIMKNIISNMEHCLIGYKKYRIFLLSPHIKFVESLLTYIDFVNKETSKLEKYHTIKKIDKGIYSDGDFIYYIDGVDVDEINFRMESL